MGALDWLSDLFRSRQGVPDPNATMQPPGGLLDSIGSGAQQVGGLLGGAITGYGERVIGQGADKASNMAKVFAALQHVGTSVAAGFGSPVAREIIAQRAMRDPQEEQARSLQLQSAQMKMDADARQRDVFSQMGAGGFDPRNPAHRSHFMDLAVQSGDMSLIDKARELESTYGKSEAPQSELGKLQLDQWKSRYAGNDPGTSADMAYQRKIDALSRPEPAKANPMRTRIEGDQTIQEELGPDGWQTVGGGPRFQEPQPRNPIAVEGPNGAPVYMPPDEAVGRKPARGVDDQDVKTEKQLRSEYMDQSKTFQTVRDMFQTVKAAGAGDNEGVSDIALIYAYMKILDPGSAVREGEYATAQNAGSIPENIANLYNKALSGAKLQPEQRAKYVSEAGKIYESRRTQQKRNEDTYRALARQYGVDPTRVVLDLSPDGEAGAGASQDVPTNNTVGGKPVMRRPDGSMYVVE